MSVAEIPLILVLEPDPSVRKALVEGLRVANRLWNVLEAADGNDALEAIIREDITVFLCSQEQRGRLGNDLLAEARGIRPEVVGMLLLGRPASSVVLENLRNAGVFRCIAKPCAQVRLLTDVVEAIVEHRRRRSVESAIKRALFIEAP